MSEVPSKMQRERRVGGAGVFGGTFLQCQSAGFENNVERGKPALQDSMSLHKDAQNCIPACSAGSLNKPVTHQNRELSGVPFTARKITCAGTETLMLGPRDQTPSPAKIFTP